MSEIRGHLRLHFRAFPEEGQWVGRCQELELSTCAGSRAEAESGIIEATTLYLETLAAEGELDQVLAGYGLTITPGGKHAGEEWVALIPVSQGAA